MSRLSAQFCDEMTNFALNRRYDTKDFDVNRSLSGSSSRSVFGENTAAAAFS